MRPYLRVLLSLLALSASCPAFAAGRRLACGQPYTVSLGAGEVQKWDLSEIENGSLVVDVIDVSGTVDLLALETGGQSTCAGSVRLGNNAPGEELTVRDCRGSDEGRYTIVAHVVSDSEGNCSTPMPCGSFPNVRRFLTAGETDAYSFHATAGDRISLRGSDIQDAGGRLRFRVFDPDGEPVAGGTPTCGDLRDLGLGKTGNHTVLVSSCGAPDAGLYQIAFTGPECPAGPDITFLGLARADGAPLAPDTRDAQGRPVYRRDFGAGFLLVTEARPGNSGRAVGGSAFEYSPDNPAILPDLQVLVSRDLGNGSRAVCDKAPPEAGGVPATPLLEFTPNTEIAAAVNDLACRADNGSGEPRGVSAGDACTSFASGDFGFVEKSSTLQYCLPVSLSWSFPAGATVVKARVRDAQGQTGAAREMVLQVGPECGGDCNGDTEVTIDEVITGVAIALEIRPTAVCNAMDGSGDGIVSVDELVAAVAHSLSGCPATGEN